MYRLEKKCSCRFNCYILRVISSLIHSVIWGYSTDLWQIKLGISFDPNIPPPYPKPWLQFGHILQTSLRTLSLPLFPLNLPYIDLSQIWTIRPHRRQPKFIVFGLELNSKTVLLFFTGLGLWNEWFLHYNVCIIVLLVSFLYLTWRHFYVVYNLWDYSGGFQWLLHCSWRDTRSSRILLLRKCPCSWNLTTTFSLIFLLTILVIFLISHSDAVLSLLSFLAWTW